MFFLFFSRTILIGKIYVYKCKKCYKLDPVFSFVVPEQLGSLRFIVKKSIPKMTCPFCNDTMLLIDYFK